MSSMFFYYQTAGGEEAWQEGLAESREEIIRTKQPRFTTVLDLSELVTADANKEQLAKIKYRGPMYADFDHTDIAFVISKVQQFMALLEEKGVRAEQVRWYITGGRGAHAEIPQEIFIAKPPKAGLPLLPAIYKEMAYELFVDSLDLRVYSARRGRQWRTPNVDRGNATFKVALTPTELLSLTPETYAQLCSAPRQAPPLEAPVFNPNMALLFAKANAKVDAAAKKQASSKTADAILAKFNGQWPPSLQRILRGEAIKDGTGFHQIALQLAVTANGLGKSEKDLLDAAELLCESHESDSFRYNTPGKRRAELARMHAYCQDNQCYSFAHNAVKALIAPGVDAADLDGMSESAGESLSAPATAEEAEDQQLRGGLDMREKGIFKKSEEGVVMICDLAFKDVRVLQSMPTAERPSELWGYESQVLLKGKPRGRQMISMEVFLSKQRFQEFAMKNSGVMKGNDNDVASLSTILRDAAEKNNMVSYVTRREGFEIVRRPDAPKEQLDLLWVQGDCVHGVQLSDDPAAAPTETPEGLYVYKPLLPSGSLYSTDLWHAPMLDASNDERAFFEALFGINEPFVLGTLLGWLTASFHRSFYQRIYKQFPICQGFGQAGSGKTQTARLLTQLHYNNMEPYNIQTGGVTPYVIESYLSASSSVPCLLDEYKPREFSREHRGRVWLMLRAAYDNGLIGKGGDKDMIGSSWKSISMNTASAPVFLIGEALETQTAIMERSVSVPMSKAGLAGRGDKFRYASRNRKMLGRLGRSILAASFGLDFEALREQTERNLEHTSKFFKEGQDRPMMNLAIVLTGFDFMSQVLASRYGGHFTKEIAAMRAAITDETKQIATAVMAEASKVMDALALMSKTEDMGAPNCLKPEQDFCHVQIAGRWFLDLRLDTTWIKYASWAQAKNQERLYDNFAAFAEGLAHYAPMIDRRAGDSRLRESGNTKIYRFDLTKLTDEGVQTFKLQPI